MEEIRVGNRYVGDGEPVYIIAEIGSNFDGDLSSALKLIDLAKSCGCDCAKFQSFLPDKIINKKAFGSKSSFQANWSKSVYDTYKDASLPREWHRKLADHCKEIGIDFMSSPYDKEAVDLLDSLDVTAFKIGSGEITNLEFLEYVGSKKRPVILGTGASNMEEIEDAVTTIRNTNNNDIILLQCVTQYPSPIEYSNIRAMVTLKEAFDCQVGYSDHSDGNITIIGAVSLGACVIEKHFTNNRNKIGPDHPFAADVSQMTLITHSVREIEKALGSSIKQLTEIEKETVIIQRRGLYTRQDWKQGARITRNMVDVLRPYNGLEPKCLSTLLGMKVKENISKGDSITWEKVSQ